ncbi:MAG: type I-B CRISPR-associated protein Cas8b/Csh1 [Epsilonproteobacteria bacterium]|nr:type I-B CRISPR-associated protein Cas8b/Csh1 [Campylobacterota bacterium]NPA56162.1 type I-B CRISPR-associated protein Cas8b/Csh1 [Campylobacterota bacterium]
MIEGIHHIGKRVKEVGKRVKEGKSVAQMAAEIPTRREGISYLIGKVNFDSEKEKVSIDLEEEYSPGKEETYRFIQLKLTGTQNKFFATFTESRRFLGEVDEKSGKGKEYAIWLSIEKELEGFPELKGFPGVEEFLDRIGRVKESFYRQGLLDLEKIKGLERGESFNSYLKKRLGPKEKVLFWTVLIDGTSVVQEPFYDQLIKKKVVDEKMKKGEVVCSLCNMRVERYFDDFARLPMKFFINDKVGFSQRLSNRWKGNFALCKECYLELFAGEKFLMNYFTARVGVIDYLIVPEFLQGLTFDSSKLRDWALYVRDRYNPFHLVKNMVHEKVQEYREFGEIDYFFLNYLFYEANKSQFKIFALMRDIPTGRIDTLLNGLRRYQEQIEGDGDLSHLQEVLIRSFGELYWLIPLHYSKGERKVRDIAKIVELFDALLEDIPLSRPSLIHDFWIGARAKYFRNRSFHNVSPSENGERELVTYVLKTGQLLILLRHLGLLKGVTMEWKNLPHLPQEMGRYLEEVGFDEKEGALFLLGVLLGDIGSKQARYGSKPILNKINFQGLSLERIQILANEIYGKLWQERLLYPEQEKIYATAKELLDRNLSHWSLKAHENLYFLLSGYAYRVKWNIEQAHKYKKEER